MNEFVENPAFWSDLGRAIEKGMDEVAGLMRSDGRRRAMEWSGRAANAIDATVQKDAQGPYVKFTTGGGLQNIAEAPKGPRRNRKGANRGTMPAHPVMVPTAEDITRHHLPLERYL